MKFFKKWKQNSYLLEIQTKFETWEHFSEHIFKNCEQILKTRTQFETPEYVLKHEYFEITNIFCKREHFLKFLKHEHFLKF